VNVDPSPRKPPHHAALGMGVLCIVLIAVICAAGVRNGCFHPGPPQLRPERGTARAGYCDAINAWKPWLSLTLAPTLGMVAFGWVVRRHGWLIWLVTVLIGCLVAANAIVANSLTYWTPLGVIG
jgi:hypothetical protein